MELNLPDGLLAWGLAAVLLFWVVGAYNRLARLRSAVVVAQAVLETHLRRYVNLIEELSVKSDATPDRGLQGAASQLTAALNAVRLKPTDEGAGAALHAALAVLGQAWQRALDAEVVDAGVSPLPGDAWNQISLRADFAREDLHRAQNHYNEAVGEIPAMIVAWFFGFKPVRVL